MAIELQGSLEGVVDEMLEGSVAGNIKLIGGTPTINELNVTSNGIYEAPEGVDGYNPVKVNVPDAVLDSISINTNGIYTPPAGIDGYDEIVVNVEQDVPSIEQLNVSNNGTYEAPSGTDGYSPVIVNVPVPTLTTLKVNANGIYTPSNNIAYNRVEVNVPVEGVIASSNNDTIQLITKDGHIYLRFDGFITSQNETPITTDLIDNTIIYTLMMNLLHYPTYSMCQSYTANGAGEYIIPDGFIGFYNNNIRGWVQNKATLKYGEWHALYDLTGVFDSDNTNTTPFF